MPCEKGLFGGLVLLLKISDSKLLVPYRQTCKEKHFSRLKTQISRLNSTREGTSRFIRQPTDFLVIG